VGSGCLRCLFLGEALLISITGVRSCDGGGCDWVVWEMEEVDIEDLYYIHFMRRRREMWPLEGKLGCGDAGDVRYDAGGE